MDQSAPNLQDALDDFLSEFAKKTVGDLRKRASRLLAPSRRQRAGFERRLQRTWREPLQLLRLFAQLSFETGATLNNALRPKASKNQDLVVEVLSRLHAHACQLSFEIIALLEHGFASGAHARWRSLHEIAAVAIVIRDHGHSAAERYLLHENVECGFATIHNWSENPDEVQGWVHAAFQRRNTVLPDNSYPSFANNRSGDRWYP